MTEPVLITFIFLFVWYIIGLILIALSIKISKDVHNVGDWLGWSSLGIFAILALIIEIIVYFKGLERLQEILKKEIFK